MSVAVATNSGLITPIVTDALGRGVQEIGSVVRDLAERARAGKLQLHEFQGGSFTYTKILYFKQIRTFCVNLFRFLPQYF